MNKKQTHKTVTSTLVKLKKFFSAEDFCLTKKIIQSIPVDIPIPKIDITGTGHPGLYWSYNPGDPVLSLSVGVDGNWFYGRAKGSEIKGEYVKFEKLPKKIISWLKEAYK